jgi:hypothetical protein
MAETITVNAVDRSGVIQRKNVEWAESAYLGEAAEGRFQIDDAAGTISIPGHKAITVVQSSSTPARIFTGYVGRKGIRRGETYTVGASREIEVATRDLNDLLRRHIIQGDGQAGGNRPAETISARLTWLLASGFLDAEDFGAVTYSTVDVDKQDCRGLYPGDALAAMAKAVRFNYYLRYNAGEDAVELVFRDDNASSADTCTLSISNVESDHSATCFPPFQEAELSQDPEHVYSGAYGTHAQGQVYETLPATATAFAERDGTIEDSGTRTDATMIRDAQTFLYESRDEEQLLPVTLRLRAAQVGLIQAGMRISTRMQHATPEGWEPARFARILRKRITQPLNTDNDYNVAVDLSPQETALAPATCSADDTDAATYFPLGGSGNTPNLVGTNIAYYHRGGLTEPQAPDPAYQGSWHFPTYGVGGTGTTDYFASGMDNLLRFIVVGNGTLTIQTERWQGQPQPCTVVVEHVVAGIPQVVGSTLTGTAGEATEVEITTADDPDCIHLVNLKADLRVSGVHIGMGWSQAVWTV